MNVSKSVMWIALAAVCFIVFSFTKGYADSPRDGIGEVKYSLLSPDLFSKTQTGKWVLLNGEPLETNTELYKLLDENNLKDMLTIKDGIPNRLPDARGVFIRGMNAGRDTITGDTDGDRKIGSYQLDTLKKHHHIYREPRRGGNGSDTDDDEVYRWVNMATTDFGGAETRPRNVALYTYVKVSN